MYLLMGWEHASLAKSFFINHCRTVTVTLFYSTVTLSLYHVKVETNVHMAHLCQRVFMELNWQTDMVFSLNGVSCQMCKISSLKAVPPVWEIFALGLKGWNIKPGFCPIYILDCFQPKYLLTSTSQEIVLRRNIFFSERSNFLSFPAPFYIQ